MNKQVTNINNITNFQTDEINDEKDTNYYYF